MPDKKNRLIQESITYGGNKSLYSTSQVNFFSGVQKTSHYLVYNNIHSKESCDEESMGETQKTTFFYLKGN